MDRDTGIEVLTPVQEFYSNSNIFLTGCTGFLGKVVLEKILYTCSQVSCVYILVRPKRNKSPRERLEEILQSHCFDRLKRDHPNFQEKIRLVEFDGGEFIVSPEDRQLLIAKVDVVVNGVATIRFDQKLSKAVQDNVLVTKGILDLCREMKLLKSVVHISTAYAHCVHALVEDRFMPTPIDCDKLLRLLEVGGPDILNSISHHLLGKWPNTYVFTKCIAEDMIRKHYYDLPISICRPTIICYSQREPYSGWGDSVHGPLAASIGVGFGLLHWFCIKYEALVDVVPVDHVANAVLVGGWASSRSRWRHADVKTPDDVLVFNVSSGRDVGLTWRRYFSLMNGNYAHAPVPNAVWRASAVCTTNALLYEVMHFITSVPKACFVDLVLLLTGQKPMALRNVNLARSSLKTLNYFMVNSFDFCVDRLHELRAQMHPADRRLFEFDPRSINWEALSLATVKQIRHYRLRVDPTTIEECKRKFRRLEYLHFATLTLAAYLLLRLALALFKFFLDCFF